MQLCSNALASYRTTLTEQAMNYVTVRRKHRLLDIKCSAKSFGEHMPVLGESPNSHYP